MNYQLLSLAVVVMLTVMPEGSALGNGGNIFSGQVRGETVEQVDGVDHVVERHVGTPDRRSLADQLVGLNLAVSPEDRVAVFPDPSFGLGSTIRITRANEVTVVDWGQSTVYRTWKTTVHDLLTERGVEIGQDDRFDKNENDTIVNKMTIEITRVEVTEIEEREPIPFPRSSIDDPELEKGQTKLLQAGKNGVKTKTFRVRRENGLRVEKSLLRSEVTTEPVPEETAKGTKVVSYGTGQATWYALKSGLGAAHNTLPKGTKVRVTNLANGKTVDVVINDHGIQGSAVIDLTKEAFEKIAPLGAGRIQVKIEQDYD